MPASFNNPHQEDFKKVAQERDVVAERSSQPKETDAVLGGKAPAPIYSVVLGGIEGVKNRLASGVPQQRITAFPEALKYGQEGFELVLQALNDESWSVLWAAYALLQENAEPALKRALRVYDLDLRLKCYRTLTGHSNSVESVAISPDGQILASGSWDNTIKLWDLPSGELKTTLTGHSDSVKSIVISPDGQILASGSWDNTIKLWDLPSGELKTTLTGHSDSVESVAISPDGQILASGSWDNTIKLWDLPSGELKTTLTGHSDIVKSIAISPDGQILASGSSDNTIKLWDLPSGELKTNLTEVPYIDCLTISPDGRILACGSRDNTIKLCNLPSGELKTTLTGHSGWVESIAISPDGQILASGSGNKTIKLWRIENPRQPRLHPVEFFHHYLTLKEALNSDRAGLGQVIQALKWDLPSGELKTTLTGHSGWVESIAISPDGQILASGSSDKTIKLWRIENPRQPRLDPVEFFHHYLTLKEALNSDKAGLEQVIQALKDESWEVHFIARVLLQKRKKPIVKQALQEYSSELSSSVGLDYARLLYLLSLQRWKEAEQETEDILLKISSCEKGADVKSILRPSYKDVFGVVSGIECCIPNQDLHTIYEVWERYSNIYSSFRGQLLPFWMALKTELEQILPEDAELSATFSRRYNQAYVDDQNAHWG